MLPIGNGFSFSSSMYTLVFGTGDPIDIVWPGKWRDIVLTIVTSENWSADLTKGQIWLGHKPVGPQQL